MQSEYSLCSQYIVMSTESENYSHSVSTASSNLTPVQHAGKDATNGKDASHNENRGDALRDDAGDHLASGDLRGQDGDFAGALSEYKKAARLSPDSAHHLSRVAEGYAANDQPYKAIEYYQRALQVSQEKSGGQEDLSEAHIGLGDLCRSFALSAAAIRSYERAVRSRPRKPYYRWKLAVALATLGLYEKSVEQLKAALEIEPDDVFYHFQLAEVYLLMRDLEHAIAELNLVVQLAPRDDYYHLRLGAALLRAEQTDQAVPSFERALALKPENPSYQTLLRYAQARNHQEPSIAVDIELIELGAYDEDFVRRIQRLSHPN